MNDIAANNSSEQRARGIALAITALAAALVVLWLVAVHIRLPETKPEWPPIHHSDVAIADEQYFDVVNDIPLPYETDDDPSPVYNEVPANNASTPAPKSGTDMTDRGRAADAPATATSRQPSPVKAKTEEPVKTGPSKEELEAQMEEEARRKANAAMNSAFNRTQGQNNTVNAGTTPGNSGSPAGTAAGINGTGSGSVGGGWILPSYAKVPSTVTGSIRCRVKVDRNGQVTSITFEGGDAPAATDPRLRQAVENEIRSRRFTRGNSPAPDDATAYITYRFR